MDPESVEFVKQMSDVEKRREKRVPGVRTVLVVLSSRCLVYDVQSLRFKILLSYPEATIFFMNADGSALGLSAPSRVDLLVDLRGEGERQSFLFSGRLRRMARFSVGRRSGFLGRRIYDRIFSERGLPEREAQRKVLELAGVAFSGQGEALPDRSYDIALGLPLLK